ncbi:MAG TPA: hypothetical protein VEX68_26860 [Bryobacteraceae bacterium]|nr:hypothetical protein [Bryobacteraceae bacterium]
MSKQDEASLILRLYELRREEVMRKARDWYVREFHPESRADIENAMYGEHGSYLRMVTSYWDMAAALVHHEAISAELFNDTNGEHLLVYSKLEPFLAELRPVLGPGLLANIEKLVSVTPGAKERVAGIRERMKVVRAEIAARQAKPVA